jgi:hypothetical protein
MSEDGYNIGGLIVTKAEVLSWADNLRCPSGEMSIRLVQASICTASEQCMGQADISDRQIHELRGGYMTLKSLLRAMERVIDEADSIRKEDAESAKSGGNA